MIKVITNFNKTDCIHHEVIDAPGCCGRKIRAGVCTILEEDGIKRHKTCSTSMSYCKYTKEENTDVHSS